MPQFETWDLEPETFLINRIEFALPVFTFNLMQQHAPAGKKFLNARSPLLAIAPRH